jgi:hypothetical protein
LLLVRYLPDVHHDLDLAGELREHILSEIIDRLELAGQEHPLVMELLQTMERREKPN